MYADDTQFYAIFHPLDKNSVIQKLVTCVNDIKVWSTSNKLKLNDSKLRLCYLLHALSPPILSKLLASDRLQSHLNHMLVILELCWTMHFVWLNMLGMSVALKLWPFTRSAKYGNTLILRPRSVSFTLMLLRGWITATVSCMDCLSTNLANYSEYRIPQRDWHLENGTTLNRFSKSSIG